MKGPKTKFQADTMSDSKVTKKSKFIIRSKFLAAQTFFLFIYILLKKQQILIRFCKFS